MAVSSNNFALIARILFGSIAFCLVSASSTALLCDTLSRCLYIFLRKLFCLLLVTSPLIHSSDKCVPVLSMRTRHLASLQREHPTHPSLENSHGRRLVHSSHCWLVQPAGTTPATSHPLSPAAGGKEEEEPLG